MSSAPIAVCGQVLRIGTSGDYPPFSVTQEKGRIIGLDVEIARRLAKDLGRTPKFVDFEWPNLAERLKANAFDVAMSGLTTTPERALIGRYSRPYATVGATLLIRVEDQERFGTRESVDREGIRIVVNKGGYLEKLARTLFRNAVIVPTADNASLPQQVLFGMAEAALSDSAEVRGWMRKELRTVGPFTRDYKAFLLRPDREDLARRIDAWMVAREKDGWMNQMRIKWLGGSATVAPENVTKDAITDLIRLRLSLMPLVSIAKRAASVPIEDRVQEGRVLERSSRGRTTDAERFRIIYRELIDLGKMIQEATPAVPSTATLPDLREAIARIDDQLLREIARVPEANATEWKTRLQSIESLPGIQDAAILRLSIALGLPATTSNGPSLVPLAPHP